MRKVTAVFVGLLASGLLSGCLAVQTPAIGLLYTEVSGPIDTEGSVGSKEGRACAESILGLVATGDASIKAAADAGGITQITTVDHHTRSVLGIIGEYCTIVRGR